MLQQLINHSPDLQKLKDEGHVLEVQNNFLLVHRVPYLNSNREIKYGTLVSSLQLAGFSTLANPEHPVYFTGETPCNIRGEALSNIINNSNRTELWPGFFVNHYFSSRPHPNGYKDYYEKITTYISILANHAKSVDSSVSEKGEQVLSVSEDSVFQYPDTNSSKPGLSVLQSKFEGQKIGIIGLGGTGSYILDLIAKVPVAEIHIYDGDWFYNNNAFRSPGAAGKDDLLIPQKKVDYYCNQYFKMHKGIIKHPVYISTNNLDELKDLSFVFLSLDKGEIKRQIVQYLEGLNISFIDVGMGVYYKNNALTGLLRVTSSTENKRDHVRAKNRIPFSDDLENEYSPNIQIAELNALNATLAVIKWKKLLGFYHDFGKEYSSFYQITTNDISNEDF